LALVLIVHDIFGTHGYLAMRRTQQEIKKVNADLDHLNKENLQLEQEVRELKTDPQKSKKSRATSLALPGPARSSSKFPVATVAARPYCEALTLHFFHVVRASESASIARKIVISPAVAFSAPQCPFGKMENLP